MTQSMFQTVIYHGVYFMKCISNIFQAHLRKALKITYQVTHPGNDKETVPLTLAILQQPQ